MMIIFSANRREQRVFSESLWNLKYYIVFENDQFSSSFSGIEKAIFDLEESPYANLQNFLPDSYFYS